MKGLRYYTSVINSGFQVCTFIIRKGGGEEEAEVGTHVSCHSFFSPNFLFVILLCITGFLF